MRKLIYLACFIVIIGLVVLFGYELMQQDSHNEARYVIGSVSQTINKREAREQSPQERWHEIRELKETVAIDVICQPSSAQIVDRDIVQQIVGFLQRSTYVEVTAYPRHEPTVKLYFRKKDGFIMAGRLYVQEGVIMSPEGPVIQMDSKAAKKMREYADCNYGK